MNDKREGPEMILNPTSLNNTVDNINQKFLLGEYISMEEGLEAARWIASRQGEKGCYRNSFAPTPTDFEQGMKTFTGEKLVSASSRHIMGQEAARAAWLLGKEDPIVREAYDRATQWMREEPGFSNTGLFCCGRCTLAYWRHTWVGDFKDKEAHIRKGLQVMKDRRIGDGNWVTLPFNYAIYTLVELDLEAALEELRYARQKIERGLKSSRTDVYAQRRSEIFKQALQKLS